MKTRSWLHKGLNVLIVAALMLSNLTLPFTATVSAAPRAAESDASAVTAMSTATTVTGSGKGQIFMDGPLGVQVNTYNGNLFYQRTDLLFPTVLPLAVSLSYNSLLAAQDAGIAGYGWRLSYDIAYREVADGTIVIIWDDGRRVRYTPQGNNTFAAPPGIYDVLTRPQAGRYLLTTASQFKYYFDSDRHQRVTRIEHPNGQALALERNAQGLLTRITHSLGHQLRFGYS